MLDPHAPPAPSAAPRRKGGLPLALLAGLAALPATGWAPPARGQSPSAPGLALVVGVANYAAHPPVPACRGAAEAVAGALRAHGFAVTERQDPTRSELDAALAAFGRQRAAAPAGPAVVYLCGLAAEWNGRAFLVPASAALARDSDLLTQGILARNAAEAATRGATGPGLVLLDLAPRPGGPLTPAGLAAAAEAATEAGAGLVAATGTAADLPVTPLAAALRAGLAGPAVEVTALVAGLRTRLPEAARLAVVTPDAPRFLAGAPPAAPEPAAPAPPRVAPAASAPAARQEADLDQADRRRIQAALGVLGHYGGRMDGSFGPETRAAIRRYQAASGAETTGRLTAPQIAALTAEGR